MVSRKASAFLLGLFLVFYTGTVVMADDTEIYDGSGSSLAAPPLVMFTIDYAPPVLQSEVTCTAAICTTLVNAGLLTLDGNNKTSRFGVLIAALKYLVDGLSGMKIGLMMSHNAENNCAGSSESGQCSGGGYMLMGFTSIGTGAWNVDSGKSEFFEKLDALKALADVADGNDTHTFQGKEVFFEFFRYLTGHNAHNSRLGWTDFGTDDTQNLIEDNPVLMRDLDIEGITLSGGGSPTVLERTANINTYSTQTGTYTSPITEDCQKIFTINFLKGVTNQDSDSDTAIKTGTKASGAMENISLQGNTNNLESVLKYLEGTDFADGTWGLDDSHRPQSSTTPGDYDLMGTQNVKSYFIVDSSGLNTGHDWAQAGGTPAAIEWGDDPQDIVDQLESIFSQILSTSTTFTAASVPVSVLNRAQIVDNVYIALFKSDPDGYETWPGNVKRLRLDTDIGVLKDYNSDNAINPNDGRIINSALTYWTESAYLPTADPDNDEIDGKDGRAVKRGGSGQQIPGFSNGKSMTIGSSNGASTRKLYYDKSTLSQGTPLSGAPLDITDAVAGDIQTDLGASDLTEAKVLIRYIRGFDVSTLALENNETITRSWIMGDPLHSRPLPINYGNASDATKPDIRLVFGSNDGFFRMIQNSDTGTDTPRGVENWGFMPRTVMSNIKKLKVNNGTYSHPYGVDGAPTAYIKDANNDGVIKATSVDGDVVGVYFGLRRGGRAIYALDITEPDTPKFQWRIDSSTTGFSELGYTFSQPKVGAVNLGSGSIPVVMFAGGYQLDKDDEIPHDGSVDTMGNAFYVVNAQTGALIWKVANGTTGNVSATEYNHTDMDDSIPSTVASIDTDGDGLTDRAYVGDTGGRVWRFDMIGTDRTTWKATVIASVGYRDSNVAGNDRRFFHRPDFIQFKDDTGDYDAVVIASGNRAHPKKDTVNDDYLYIIKDRNTTGLSTMATLNHSDANDFYDVTDNCLQNTDVTCTDDDATITAKIANGWKLKFEETGEKSLATPTTLAKKIFVTTYLPEGGASSGDCSPKEGAGRLYALSLIDGSAVNDYDVSNGDVMEKTDRFTELDSGGIPAEVVYVPFNRILKPDLSIENVGVSGRWKTYWYKQEH